MRRVARYSARLGTWLALTGALASMAFAEPAIRIEPFTFDSNVQPGSGAKPIQLWANLYLPAIVQQPVPAMILTPSSGGVRDDVELHYARNLARSGIAALVIDSFGPRGVAHTIHDQRLVGSWDLVRDAIAGLRLLMAERRIQRDRIGIMGVSKGGIAAMFTALPSVMRWAGAADLRFAAHIAIVPHCGWIPRELATTGSPILFLLAELDDQSPPDDCVRHADRLRKAGNPDVAVHLYKGVHHGWEVLGAVPHFDRRAENFAKCRAILDEDGTSTAPDGTLVPANKSRAWAEATCITLGGWCCGGNEAHKTRATGDVVDFLRKHGF